MSLDVYVGADLVGMLAQSDRDRRDVLFTYGHGLSEGAAISLTMPVVRDPYLQVRGLHPIFDMNLPEGELGNRLYREFSKAATNFDEIALLGIIGSSQIGHLRFAEHLRSLQAVPAQSVSELLLHDGARGLFEDLLYRYAAFSGVSGVQPKVLICDADVVSPERITHRGATHIVKAWDATMYPQLAANEFFCMRAAALCGMRTPVFSLSNNGLFFVLERFDLDRESYLGFEDFCVLNGIRSKQKYYGSYERIAKRIRQFVSPQYITASLEEFFCIVALSSAVKNGDAHLKNFGVVYADATSDVRLAPAYDIVSTTPYIPNDALALTLAGSKRFPSAQTLIRFAREHCDISEQRSKEIFARMADAMTAAAAEMRSYAVDHQEFAVVAKLMQLAWDDGIRYSLQI